MCTSEDSEEWDLSHLPKAEHSCPDEFASQDHQSTVKSEESEGGVGQLCSVLG